MSIKDYFDRKCIFITGGSGFMGKVLIEKLLRTCPNIEKIFILLRTKRGKTNTERINEIINAEVFNVLKKNYPGLLESKLHAINGDVIEPNLGISREDKKCLVKKISIFYHVASSIRFVEPIKNSILMNLRGTRNICQLALEMCKLEVFQYVSTAYSNANRKVIDEILYEPHGDWRKFIEIAENFDDDIEFLTAKMLGSLPNTYVFTKSMAENIVYDLLNEKVPSIVLRPSIVISSAKEPIIGWVDNFNGPMSVMIGGGKGLLRTVYADPKTKLDYIPVDDAIKGMIVSAWKKGKEGKKSLSVYNACSNKLFSVSMGEMVNICNHLNKHYPYANPIWYGIMTTSTTLIVFWLRAILLHLPLLLFLDFFIWITNKKPTLLKIFKQIYQTHLALRYYMFNEWNFLNDKFMDLQNHLENVDVDEFKYQMINIDVYDYFEYAGIGFKKYLLREDMLEFDNHKTVNTRMKYLHYFVNAAFYCSFCWVAFNYLKTLLL